MRRPVVILAALAVLLALPTSALAGRKDDAPRFELSVGHSIYPHQPRITSMNLSVKAAEFSGLALYGDVGYGLGRETKDDPKTDGVTIGISAGQRGHRMRWGVQYHTPSREVQVFVRARLLGF